jgi:HAD superfamily hydrolase (TIGR01490 family)
MRLAIFDIDGTLVAGPSTEKRFALHLARHGRLGPRQALAFLAFLPAGMPRFGRHVLKKDKAWLAGLREEEVAALAVGWAQRALARDWFEPCLARLARHRQAGDTVALLSGTPQVVADAIGAALGVGTVLGTRCATGDGRFLARAPLAHPFGADKVAMAGELAHAHGAELADVTAYADSIHDLPLFLAVGKPVAVRPDERLAAEARARGWEVLGEVRRGFLRTLIRPGAAPLSSSGAAPGHGDH